MTRTYVALRLGTIAAVLTIAQLSKGAEPITASSSARCIFITESDGTLVAVCGKAVR